MKCDFRPLGCEMNDNKMSCCYDCNKQKECWDACDNTPEHYSTCKYSIKGGNNG